MQRFVSSFDDDPNAGAHLFDFAPCLGAPIPPSMITPKCTPKWEEKVTGHAIMITVL